MASNKRLRQRAKNGPKGSPTPKLSKESNPNKPRVATVHGAGKANNTTGTFGAQIKARVLGQK